MSRYDWPDAPGADLVAPKGDNKSGRRRFNRQRYTGLAQPQAQPDARATGKAAKAARASAPQVIARSSTRQSTLSGARPGGPSRAPASADALLWQPLGPQALLGGQATGSPRVSGRVNAVCPSDDGQRVYAAAANGGIWYSRDGGGRWVSVGGLAATDVTGIARPAHRNVVGSLLVLWGGTVLDNETVFVGTGEPHQLHGGLPGNANYGVGIMSCEKPVAGGVPKSDDPWTREATNLTNQCVYRVAANPAGDTIYAATNTGLYQRPAEALARATWPRVDAAPFKDTTVSQTVTDVLVTPAHGGRPERTWVWVETGANFGLWVRDGNAGDFRAVLVDGPNSAFAFQAARGLLAALPGTSTVPGTPTVVWLLINLGNKPGLFRVSNPTTASAAEPEALAVDKAPDIFHGSAWYNMALAVDPIDENRVVMGGSYFGDPNIKSDRPLYTTRDGARLGYDAGIVSDVVQVDPLNPLRLVYGTRPAQNKFIGLGVHPDVHALVFSNGNARLWCGCDGGVFRSDLPTATAGFYAVNTGLSISESNFLACHPLFEGDMMAGLQDNGTVTRVSSHSWRITLVADGGGVMYDPVNPDRWMAQYVQGTWSTPTAPWRAGPIFRTRVQATENGNSSFYTQPACIAHVRGVRPIAQLLIGTDRLWYSDSFGRRWVTLPRGTDPLPAVIPEDGAAPNSTVQDNLGESIISARWQGPDVAWVLCPQTLLRFRRTPGSHQGGGPGTWQPWEVVATRVAPAGPPPVDPIGPMRRAATWTEIQPNTLPPVDATPLREALYLGTTGLDGEVASDTLWWFDGEANSAAHWHATGLRSRGGAGGTELPAPVTAIAVDDDLPNEVWVGTTVGVVHGLRSWVDIADPDPGAPGHWQWDWTPQVTGLPEAPVEDIAVFKGGAPDNLRLLRVAIAARGVWELRLDTPLVPQLSYLRVHSGDLRHRASVRLARHDGTERSWHASPDIRPRLAPSDTLPAPGSLPWQRTSRVSSTSLRQFQAALKAATNDPRVHVTGTWDAYFSEVLRDRGATAVSSPADRPLAGEPALPNRDVTRIDADFWNQYTTNTVKGANADKVHANPWGTATPSEADLLDLTPSLPEGSATEAATRLAANKDWIVDVVVAQRGRQPVDGDNVQVTLLWWVDTRTVNRARYNKVASWAPGNVPWAADVQAMLNNPLTQAAPDLSDGWHYAMPLDPAPRASLAGQTLDPLNPGVVSFRLNVGAHRNDSVVLLVAVLRSGTDLVIEPVPLRELVLNNPAVAVRAVRIIN